LSTSLAMDATRSWWERSLRNTSLSTYAKVAGDIRIGCNMQFKHARERVMSNYIEKVVVTTNVFSGGGNRLKEQKSTTYGYFCNKCQVWLHPQRVDSHVEEHL